MTLLLLLFSTSTTFNNFQMDQDFYLFTSSMQLMQEDPRLTFGKKFVFTMTMFWKVLLSKVE